MPAITHYLIIAPVADQQGVLDRTGFHTNTPLYTASDPAPRTQTYGWTGTSYTAAQETAIEDPVDGARIQFPNTHFEKYLVPTQAGLPGQRLTELGLTTSDQ